MRAFVAIRDYEKLTLQIALLYTFPTGDSRLEHVHDKDSSKWWGEIVVARLISCFRRPTSRCNTVTITTRYRVIVTTAGMDTRAPRGSGEWWSLKHDYAICVIVYLSSRKITRERERVTQRTMPACRNISSEMYRGIRVPDLPPSFCRWTRFTT